MPPVELSAVIADWKAFVSSCWTIAPLDTLVDIAGVTVSVVPEHDTMVPM